MPATCAHPLIVLPLKKLFPSLSLIALVIGSMGPDLAYFMPFLGIPRTLTHSVSDILICSYPIALIGYYIYIYLLRKPLYRSLPWNITIPYETGSFISITLSLLLGIVSHLAVDSFTHADTIITDNVPFLTTYLFSMGHTEFFVYSTLQYSLSLFGTVAITAILVSNYRSKINVKTNVELKRLLPLTSALLISTITTLLVVGKPETLYHYIISALNIFPALFILLLNLLSKLYHDRYFGAIPNAVGSQAK